jgi:hypothetical protein
MDKVQKSGNSKCSTPSSEPFIFYFSQAPLNYSLLTCFELVLRNFRRERVERCRVCLLETGMRPLNCITVE